MASLGKVWNCFLCEDGGEYHSPHLRGALVDVVGKPGVRSVVHIGYHRISTDYPCNLLVGHWW